MSIHIEKTTAPDACVCVNKFSNEKIIVVKGNSEDKHFIHFGYKQEAPLIGNYFTSKKDTKAIYHGQVRVRIDEGEIYLSPVQKDPKKSLIPPFLKNDWERIRLDELAL